MLVTASTTVLGTLGLSILAVMVDPLWRWTGRLATLVHEAGHATTLLATGNWPRGVLINPGGGGETILPDRVVFWPSAVLAASAGYTAPSIAGLVLARAVTLGWDPAATLGVLLVIVTVLVFFNGNWFGLAVLGLAGLALALFFWRAPAAAQVGAITALAWFLLLGGLRRLWELTDQPASSVADFAYLARRTGIPAAVWFLLIDAVAVLALITAARWLLTSHL